MPGSAELSHALNLWYAFCLLYPNTCAALAIAEAAFGVSIAGFSIRSFGLIAALIPIVADDTPESLRDRAVGAGMLSEYLSLFQEHRSDGKRLRDRLQSLRLKRRPSDGCLVGTGDDADAVETLLLPTEAFGVVIDMVALDVFAGRKLHRGLSPEDVLTEISKTCIAGGRTFGAVRSADIRARLACIYDGLRSEPSGSPSLTAVLHRVAVDYDHLQALCSTYFAGGIMKALPGLRPWPSPASIRNFAAGNLPCLLVPFSRHALQALPSLSAESSCFALSYQRSLV